MIDVSKDAYLLQVSLFRTELVQKTVAYIAHVANILRLPLQASQLLWGYDRHF